MTLNDCLKMETRIWHVAPFIADFKNGVQSKLITKKKPEWTPSRLEDVDLELDIRAKIIHAYAPVRFWTVYKKDYYDRPINFALPNEKEILEAQLVNGLNTVEKAVRWFKVNGRGKKYGITEKVTDVLNRQAR
ncbi:hypothetical protein G6F56_013215 [Rhizopus delemar]|nr:hypothetical protein G6F56_013215 [Rhizopus delemar]